MGKIEERINGIVEKRKSWIKKIEAVKENISEAKECVKEVETFKGKYYNLDKEVELLERLKCISTEEFEKAYEEYENAIEKLYKRFKREELHISFVGKAGQGKSLVLQKISGLNSTIIPSADGMDCTGAKSIITNQDVAETYAKITFFSKEEVIQIVNKYIGEIFHNEKYYVNSIAEIKKLPKDEMEKDIDFTYHVEESLKYTHLKKYIEHIGEIEDNLGKIIEIEEKDIESYVAQYSSNQPKIKYYTYLGVKEANIICNFPHKDTGKVVLVDTIGIGATSLGTEESMLETVENDSDAIILMCRPEALRSTIGYGQDADIINKIASKISPEYAKELLFWVINRVTKGEGVNEKHIPELIQFIEERKYPIAGIIDVDCSDGLAVEQKLLERVLQVLTERIEVVDKIIIEKVNSKGESFCQEYAKLKQAIEKILINEKVEDIKRKLDREIDKTINVKMLNEVRELYLKEYKEKRNLACEELEREAEIKLKNIIKSVPKTEEIRELLNNGQFNQHDVMMKCQNIMRIKIIDDFRKLDIVLEKLVCDMKKKIIHILVNEDKGRLGYIMNFDDKNPKKWIEDFIEKVECEEKYPLLTKVLYGLKDFKISVEGFLIFEVRDKLDPIDSSLQKHTPEINNNLAEKERIVDEIVFWLEQEVEEIYTEIRLGIMELYTVPNRALFAAVKDFYDRAAFSEDDTGSVRKEWRYLYEDWINLIWYSEYKEHMANQVHAKEWEDIIDNLNKHKEEQFIIGI